MRGIHSRGVGGAAGAGGGTVGGAGTAALVIIALRFLRGWRESFWQSQPFSQGPNSFFAPQWRGLPIGGIMEEGEGGEGQNRPRLLFPGAVWSSGSSPGS